MKKFQDKKLHDEIWDIYTSITPRQIIEELDTFLIATDDAGGGAAWVSRCIDEALTDCGPPDTPNTKWMINFDPIDSAPTSGQAEAYFQPGKLKDALEVDALKGTLIHENAHILSLSSSQADNDSIPYEELCDDNWECNDNEIRRIFAQKEAACAPNFYDDWAGCLKEDSYLNKFFQKFWTDIYREYIYGGEQVISADAFHQKYYDQFVSNYAATNPAEDFAETFTTFVLWDDEEIDNYKKWCAKDMGDGWNLINEQGLSYWKQCEKIYRDNSIWEEKIRFFYDFPELVEMRNFIRSNL